MASILLKLMNCNGVILYRFRWGKPRIMGWSTNLVEAVMKLVRSSALFIDFKVIISVYNNIAWYNRLV